MSSTNAYSTTWFALFLQSIPPAQTEREIGFITRQLPQPAFTSVLDLCCGRGRHARLLAARGYQVTGLDRDGVVLEQARRESAERVRYIERDMRDLDGLSLSYDAVVNLWQSFGYFDDATNEHVLEQMSDCLRPGGRLILDLYHRGFFERHEGEQRVERAGIVVVERKRMTNRRLSVHLDYGANRGTDRFDWRLYTPDDISSLAGRYGLRPLLACTAFDEAQPASEQHPRMQLVFEKRRPGKR